MSFEDAIPESMLENMSERLPCVLLVDCSSSMQSDDQIGQVNRGMQSLLADLKADSKARQCVELTIISFGGATPQQEMDWTEVENIDDMPRLTTRGATPMSQAITMGLDLLNQRVKTYSLAGLMNYVPWMYLITDGYPTDDAYWSDAVSRVRAAQTVAPGRKSPDVTFFAIATLSNSVTKARLEELTDNNFLLEDYQFGEMFKWLSASLKTVSQSKIGEGAQLERPTMLSHDWNVPT